jgi:hypothetical protein
VWRSLTSGKPVPSLGLPDGSPHPAQRLCGRKPEPSQRGQSFPSCRKHSTSFGDSSCAERAKLLSANRTSLPGGQASGCANTAGATSLSNSLILYHLSITSKLT